jgi:hypothetical protein
MAIAVRVDRFKGCPPDLESGTAPGSRVHSWFRSVLCFHQKRSSTLGKSSKPELPNIVVAAQRETRVDAARHADPADQAASE